MKLSTQPTTQMDVPISRACGESLYKSGMTGWGAKHYANLDQAVRSTGLNLSQVKVLYIVNGCMFNTQPQSASIGVDQKEIFEEEGCRR